MGRALTRAERVGEAMAAHGTREPRETAEERLWTAVWALVAVSVLVLAAVAGSVALDETWDNAREEAREKRALEILVVSCFALEGREAPPAPCLRPDVQDALDDPAP